MEEGTSFVGIFQIKFNIRFANKKDDLASVKIKSKAESMFARAVPMGVWHVFRPSDPLPTIE